MIRYLLILVAFNVVLAISCSAADPVAEIVVSNAILRTIESTVIPSQVAGIISGFDAKEGMNVSEGQVLGKVHDEAVRLELARLKTAIEIAKKKHASDIDHQLAVKSQAVSENEYQRAVRANQLVRDTYPANEIDRLKLIADRAKLEVERTIYMTEMSAMEVSQAEHEYRKSYEVYTRHQIKSPVSGVITSVEKKVGEWVEPGSDLVRVVRLDRLRIEGFINAENAINNLVGRNARVTVEMGAKTLETIGTVVFVSPDVNSVNSQVRVHLEIENANNQLRPGLQVKTSILSAP